MCNTRYEFIIIIVFRAFLPFVFFSVERRAKSKAQDGNMKKTKGIYNASYKRPKYIGTHLICELFGCKGDLNSERLAKKALVLAVEKVGARLLYVKTHKFSPQGLTAFALLAESHISFHTWPEYGLAALDIFTCSKKSEPKEGLKVFENIYMPAEVRLINTERGKGGGYLLEGDWHTDAIVPGIEYLVDDKIKLFIKIKKRIFHQKSKFQDIEVVDTFDFGRALILDGILQTTQKDEFIYHEMLVHPAMAVQKNPQRVLIIGGGDGGALREVLKYPTVKEAHLCEIDKMVVDVSKRFIPQISQGAFDNPKTKLHFEDGAKFVEKFTDYFDAVIVDSTDPLGPSKVLFSTKFYMKVFKALRPKGVLSLQGGVSSITEFKTLRKIVSRLRRIYRTVEVRRAYVNSYGSMTNFILAYKTKAEPTVSLNFRTRYYTPQIHKASKILPAYLEKEIK